ncbi:MAG TPA: NB-ARC domain-containing protein, partial [Armatimonadaceae bacterium]|nr:NB-ARC domain-containing protein [Armatimonadaceae bacterium]
MALPTGTITFLLTDVEGSTGLFEKYPKIMNGVLARHEQLGIESVDRHQGCLIRARGEGDSTFSVFARASDAVAAACDFQRALRAEHWPDPISLRVRMALHTGEANLRDNDYYGSSVNRCARLRAIARGGQVLLSGATVALVRGEMPPGVGVKHLGEHRLRDLEYPEQVYQLLHPDLPDDFGHLLSLDTLPNNLPQQLTSFIGREAEITDVESQLSPTRRNRILTITGPGGCGKTRLALQVAANVLDGFPDGVWWVDLGRVTDPAFVPREVAIALGLREEPNIPLRETLANWLKDRHVLLVLDNCEHLLDACSTLSQELLMACPWLRILASSREVMGVSGETVYRVPLLSLPDPDHLPPPTDLGDYEAVQLFVERAAAQRPGFVVTPKNAFAVAQVCQRLDGMPLAIELAAARVRALSVDEINRRLEDQGLILVGDRHVLPRQKTLTATMDWSYNLLRESERVLLHRLSIFRGTWTLDAAESVCSDADSGAAGGLLPVADFSIERWELVDLLTSLVDKSLVQYEESDGVGHYRVLETIRQYAYKWLADSGNAETLHRKHAAWYLEALQWHAQRLEECAKSEKREEGECRARERWLEGVRGDYMNAQAAVEWALGHGEIRTVTKFIEHLFPYWLTVGYITEGRKLYARVLQTVRANAVLRDAESPALDGTVEAI